MTTLKKHDFTGAELGGVKVHNEHLSPDVKMQLIKDYIVAIRRNKRQWNANTKVRNEIQCSTKKPHPQKGTGRARQGTIIAPQYRGGATVFGPRTKYNQHVRINQKERRAAIQHLLNQRILNGDVLVLKIDFLEQPKTQLAASYLEAIGIAGKKVLVVGKSRDPVSEILVKSLRNIPGVSFLPAQAISGYDLLSHQKLIVVEQAVDELQTLLGSAK